KRLDSRRDRAFRATGTGTVRVSLERDQTTHMDFSDLQVLGARTRAEQEIRERVLSLVKSYTRAFFGMHLTGLKSPLLDGRNRDQLVESVQKFGAAKRGR